MITIDILCQECSAKYSLTIDREVSGYERLWDCARCGGGAKRIPSSPTVLKASWPDGRRSAASRDLQEAAKLELEKAVAPSEKRGEIQKTIDKLKKL
jgi:hypothetical protein